MQIMYPFLPKIAKNSVFALCREISIAEVRLHFNLVRKCQSAITEVRLCFNLVRKCRSAIAKLHCASTESKSLLWKLRCALEIKKIQLRILRCTLTG